MQPHGADHMVALRTAGYSKDGWMPYSNFRVSRYPNPLTLVPYTGMCGHVGCERRLRNRAHTRPAPPDAYNRLRAVMQPCQPIGRESGHL